MIGFWNYTVVLTFMGLISTVIGIMAATEGHFTVAIVCLALSGFFDLFDGKVARTKKDRTDNEKLYGIQLDSLCDVVCFGVFPSLICYRMGLRGVIGLLIIVYYCVLAVTRLAYFNVLEVNRHIDKNNTDKDYHGLPVTNIAIFLPLAYLISYWLVGEVKTIVLGVILFITGTLFVVDFRVRRWTPRQAVILILVMASVLAACIYMYHF